MNSSLLTTKLRMPPLMSHLVHRARLIDALEHAIADSKVVLVSAPAGYGKTTLVSHWAHASPHRVAWLSISEEENDPERFFRYLLAAWDEVQPGIRESPLGYLLGATNPNGDSVVSAFINVASDLPGHTVFVLDDVHLLTEPSIHTALAFLIDHLPPTLHFVLAGRAEPPLPLARYRARHELTEIRTEDLQFSVEETEEFWGRLMGLNLSLDEIIPLHARLEGWIAGLQLVSLTLRNRRHVPDSLVLSGRHRFIADYLSQDVFEHLPEESQIFLLQTSILDRMCSALCDVVRETERSQDLLERLERENVFVVALDVDRTWFRYHQLFAEFLQHELTRRRPDDVARLHRRAAEWYLAQDLPDAAFRHAVAGSDVDLVMQISEDYMAAKLHGGEQNIVERWLAATPEGWVVSHPVLGLMRVAYLMFTGDLANGARHLDEIEQRVRDAPSADQPRHLAKVAMIRCAIACFQNDLPRAETYADRALRGLADEDLSYRADAYHALGDTYRRNGRWGEARASYRKVLDIAHEPSSLLRSAHVFGALADLELRRGRLREADRYWRKALAAIQQPENWGRLPLPVIGWVYLRMGELFYERNELAEAWDHLSRGLERAELGGDVRALIAGYLLASRIRLTEGNVEAAIEDLERARPLLEEASFPEWTSRFERIQLELWLAQDRLRAAVAWADDVDRGGDLASRADGESAQLGLARVLIVKGDAPARERAQAVVARLLQTAEADGRVGIQIEALALRALAHWQEGERAGAMTSLERALRLAEPEGYVRLFADLGLPMARLLQEARSRDVMPEYVETLLAACAAGLASPASEERALPEPLSHREQEVLSLIAAGLTNREIAAALFISPETVKKHTGGIYGKLGVSHRTSAAARARELDLLD